MDFLFLFSSLLSYLLLYKYAALFVLIFFAGVGFPIPENTLLLAVGAFASQSYFSFSLSLATALLANILGDLFDYFVVRKYGSYILKKNYHKNFPLIHRFKYYIKLLEQYIKKHEAVTIFVTRFLGSASVIVNFLSGLIPVSFKVFFIFDAAGNFLNIILMLLFGFFMGASWQDIANIIGLTGTVISTLIFIVFFVLIFKIKFRNNK
jgi:membrane protein DedA with SNARE-associated domain